jgi:hypothetical protein
MKRVFRTEAPLGLTYAAGLWLGIVLLLAVPRAQADSNYFEMKIARYSDPAASGMRYSVAVYANKDGASTCHLTTPGGTFALPQVNGEFNAEENPDYRSLYFGMGISAAVAATSEPWTVVWDQGTAAEVVANVTYCFYQEDDFPPLPEITSPAHDALILNPDPNPFPIEWTYVAGDPCEVTPSAAQTTVCLVGPAGEQECDDGLPCATRTMMPSYRFSNGTWRITILSRAVRCSGGINVTQGEWAVSTEGWGELVSYGLEAPYAIEIRVLPTLSRSWGAIKAAYRD